MKKQLITLVLGSAALLASAQSIAQDVDTEFYVLGQAGIYDWDDVSDMDKATARVAIGALKPINDTIKLGLEGGYHHYFADKASAGNVSAEYKRNSVDLLAVIDASVNEKVNVFGKAGGAYVNNSGTVTVDNYSITATDNVVVPKVGAGIGVNVTENTNLNLSFNHEFERDSSNHYSPSASSAMLGIKYTF